MPETAVSPRQDPGRPAPPPTWHPLQQVQDELERMVQRYWPSRWVESRVPNGMMAWDIAMDVAESADALDVTLDVPGLSQKDIDIVLADNVLTIRGERKSDYEQRDKDYHVVERSHGAFQRRVRLHCDVDQAQVTAAMDHGVLRIHLPKSAKAKSAEHRIPIKAA
jgi:HSP20 family protein